VQIVRERIVSMLRNRGQHARAAQVEYSLPATVDTEVHREPLLGLGLYEEDLLLRFGAAGPSRQ